LKINILNIPEDGLNLQFSLAEDSFPDLISDKEKFAFSLRQVDVSSSLRKVRQSIFFTGTLDAALEMPCSRCLETANLALKTDFNYTLLPEVATSKEEIELRTEDLDVSYYTGELIDLTKIIFEQVMLQIPMKALCNELCKGLCPRCGINLNVEKCDCSSNFTDKRLAVLKNFKV
jgi:uncharacterized protein